MRRNLKFPTVLLLLVFVAVTLSACSGINRPFAREKTLLGSRDPVAPPVSVATIDGVPEASARRLGSQLYTESRRRGFTTTMDGDVRDGFAVTGQMTAAPTADGTTVVYVWDVWDPSRRHHQRITGEETIAGAQFGDPWDAVDDSAMQRIASATSEQLAGFVSKMGYEIRMASVPPPASMLDDSADSITTASITTGLTIPSMDQQETGQVAALTGPVAAPRVQEPAPSVAAPTPAAQSGANLAERPEQSDPAPRPTAIAVPMVTGAPGKGNAELARAMRAALQRSGIPVVDERQDGALTVAGSVEVKPADGGQQTVALAWQVLDTRGNVIGTIAQNNQVPAGSLDNGFGDNAKYAAEAAAGGIFQLLGRTL